MGGLLLLLVACSSSSTPEPAAPSIKSTVVIEPTGSPGGVVLREVGFDTAFVEIANTGAADATGLVLEVDGTAVDAGSVAAGDTVVVDGVSFGAGAGELVLRDDSGRALDRAAWPLPVGDFVPASVAVIGRAPGMDDPFSRGAWVVYPAGSATPGAPNHLPGVEVMLPLDGVILTGTEATLAWYPVPGAASYRVEISTDDSFSGSVLETSTSEPALATGLLAPGHYVWRVRTVGEDGRESAVSEVSGFELRAEEDRAPPPVRKQLSVPYVTQHKDTAMLLLEEPHETMPMAWDQNHPIPNHKDLADKMNCALAMIAMTNAFYGGDLSQDRIGYEKLKTRQPGPEEDLMYGYGLNSDDATAAFEFALGGPVEYIPTFKSFDDAWALITVAIDSGTPVPGAGPRHGYVISGYQVEANGHRVIVVNDPANGRGLRIDLDSGKGTAKTLSLWRLQGSYVGRKQEKSVTTDTDKDGVVDFDETERFKTNPNVPDTDQDKVRDKQDVITGVFDPEHGYAFHPGDSGRDWDGDLVPTELDPDSDEGGCKDGDEDTNRNGHRNGKETWNFDVSDDEGQCCPPGRAQEVCVADTSVTFESTSHGVIDFSGALGTNLITNDFSYTVNLDVHVYKEEGVWVDNKSTYTVSGKEVIVQLAQAEGIDCTITQTTQFTGSGLADVGLGVSPDGVAVLSAPGIDAEPQTTISAKGSFTDFDGTKKSCDTFPTLLDGVSAATIDSGCPIGGSAITGTYDEETHVVDLSCTDRYESESGTFSVTSSGAFAI